MDRSLYIDIIEKQKNPDKLIYVGIGSAACRIKKNRDEYVLYDEDNQQYPVFLKNIKNAHPDFSTHIFLIDPNLEEDPFITKNGGWKKMNDEIYHNNSLDCTLYSIKEYVNYEENKWEIFFNKLIDYSMKHDWMTFCMDYTGIQNYKYRQYFNTKISQIHLDHIIFGFFADDMELSTCLIDMTKEHSQFVYYKINNRLRIYNPYAYNNDYHKIIPDMLSFISESQKGTANIQTKIFLKEKKRKLRELFSGMRILTSVIKKNSCLADHNIDFISEILKYFNIKYNDTDIICKYDEYRCVIRDKWYYEMIKYIYMIYDVDSYEMIEIEYNKMMNENDPDLWDKYVNKLYINYDDHF